MKFPGISRHGRIAAPLCGILGVGAAVLSSNAQVTLTNNNSTVGINPNSITGMQTWSVDNTDHLYAQTVFYRIGNNPEAGLDSLIFNGVVQPFGDQASLSWSGAGFDLQIQYSLLGGSAGSGASDIAEAIKVINTTGNALDFHLFLYTDLDLGGTLGGDSVNVNYFAGPPSLAGYDRAIQVDGIYSTEVTVYEHAARADAGVPGLGGIFTDGVPNDLPGSGASVGAGPGDVAFAFQWDLNVGVGSWETITVDKRMEVIPEPTTAALSLLGLALVWNASRRRRV